MYIFCFLHQTTTKLILILLILCCISFVSYIKPQPIDAYTQLKSVVYLLFPTSNHNLPVCVISWLVLYIFCFLHQTTTKRVENKSICCCISFVSYIKPQLCSNCSSCVSVVYLLFPTSNHNTLPTLRLNSLLYIFCFLHQTTTNLLGIKIYWMLYIFCFLHQTTTL